MGPVEIPAHIWDDCSLSTYCIEPGAFRRRSLQIRRRSLQIGVVAEAMNEDAREFYLHHEFIPFTDNPNKLFIAMKTIGKAFVR
jgi:hypothetical protein